MTIIIKCPCGEYLDHDDHDEELDSEDYTPYEITCSECGEVMNLCIHIEYVNEGKI